MNEFRVNILASSGETAQGKQEMWELMDERWDYNNGYSTMPKTDPDYSVWLQFELSKEVIVKQVLIFNVNSNNVLQAENTRNLLLRVGNIKVDMSKSYKEQNKQIEENAQCSKWPKEGAIGERIDMRCHESQQGKFVSIQVMDKRIQMFGLTEVQIFGEGKKFDIHV